MVDDVVVVVGGVDVVEGLIVPNGLGRAHRLTTRAN